MKDSGLQQVLKRKARNIPHEPELKSVKYVECKAAKAIMQVAREGFKANYKADNRPVTMASIYSTTTDLLDSCVKLK